MHHPLPYAAVWPTFGDVIDNSADSAAVVMACHSELRWNSIVNAIASLHEQTRIPDQIIVTVDHNVALAERLRSQFRDLTVVLNESGSRGASGNRNCGANAATASLIAFLDDDEVAAPDWLERLIEPFGGEAVVGTGGRSIAAWAATRPVWFPPEFAWTVGAHYRGMPTRPTVVRNVWAGSMVVRAEVFRRVGGFRADFGKVGDRSQPEDTDLCIRMAAAVPGGHWVYVPAAIIHHEVPAERGTFGFFVRRCYSEGHGKVLLRRSVSAVSAGALSDEASYLRTTVPNGARIELRQGLRSLSRIGAMVVGVTAAGLGAAVATLNAARH